MLKTVKLNVGLETIGDSAFYNCFLYGLEIPEGVTTIGNYAFRENKYYLAKVTLPSTITSIGSGAFYQCFALKDMDYLGTEEQWNTLITFGSSWNASVNADFKINFLGEE